MLVVSQSVDVNVAIVRGIDGATGRSQIGRLQRLDSGRGGGGCWTGVEWM